MSGKLNIYSCLAFLILTKSASLFYSRNVTSLKNKQNKGRKCIFGLSEEELELFSRSGRRISSLAMLWDLQLRVHSSLYQDAVTALLALQQSDRCNLCSHRIWAKQCSPSAGSIHMSSLMTARQLHSKTVMRATSFDNFRAKAALEVWNLEAVVSKRLRNFLSLEEM